jgi:hypothetical protein
MSSKKTAILIISFALIFSSILSRGGEKRVYAEEDLFGEITTQTAGPVPTTNKCSQASDTKITSDSQCFLWGEVNCCRVTSKTNPDGICDFGSSIKNTKATSEEEIKNRYTDVTSVVCPGDITKPKQTYPTDHECGVTAGTKLDSRNQCFSDKTNRCCYLSPKSTSNKELCVKADPSFTLKTKKETVLSELKERYYNPDPSSPEYVPDCGFSQFTKECGTENPTHVSDCSIDAKSKCCIAKPNSGSQVCLKSMNDPYAKKDIATWSLEDAFDGDFECGKTLVPSNKNDCGTIAKDKSPNLYTDCFNDKASKCCFVEGVNGNKACIEGGNAGDLKKFAEKHILEGYEAEEKKINCGYSPWPVENQCGKTSSDGIFNKTIQPSKVSQCSVDKDCCMMTSTDLRKSLCVLAPVETNNQKPEISEAKLAERYEGKFQCSEKVPEDRKVPTASECGKVNVNLTAQDCAAETKTRCCYVVPTDTTAKAVCVIGSTDPKANAASIQKTLKTLYGKNANSVVCSTGSSFIKLGIIVFAILFVLF